MKPATLEDLRARYDYWGEHPDYTVAGWVYDVDEDNTRLGYWEWVAECIREECEDDDFYKDVDTPPDTPSLDTSFHDHEMDID